MKWLRTCVVALINRLHGIAHGAHLVYFGFVFIEAHYMYAWVAGFLAIITVCAWLFGET